MNRQTLADVLQSTNQTGSYTLATVLEGAEAGSQLLLRDGDALWQTQSAELLQRQLAVLQACTATGFLTLEGQRVFAERFGAVPQLVVCGGGHVAAALVKQAKLLGIPVLAIDDREEFAQQLRAAGADTVLCAPFAQALQGVPGGAETYFAVLTRSHVFDLDCLTRILQKPAAYVGMMGSRGRAALVRRQLLESGLDSQRIDALCAPIGLAIGAQTAAEIALSILAQIVQVKMPAPRPRAIPLHCWMRWCRQKKPAPRRCWLPLLRGTAPPRGMWAQNARSARWQYSGQCGRRHYGALHGTGGSEAVSTGCARLAMLTAFG